MVVCMLCNHQERAVADHDLIFEGDGSDREELTAPLCAVCAAELRRLDWTDLSAADSDST